MRKSALDKTKAFCRSNYQLAWDFSVLKIVLVQNFDSVLNRLAEAGPLVV